MKYLVLALFVFSNLVWANDTNNNEDVKAQIDNYYWQAARAGSVEMLQEFVNVNYDLNKQDAKGYTAIILSAYNGHYDAVKLLVDAGANPCLKDKRGNTALMGAIFKGEIRISKLLMSTSCDVNDTNNLEQTPAMYAALFKRQEVLEALKSKGADLNKVDSMGNSVKNLAKGEFVNNHY